MPQRKQQVARPGAGTLDAVAGDAARSEIGLGPLLSNQLDPMQASRAIGVSSTCFTGSSAFSKTITAPAFSSSAWDTNSSSGAELASTTLKPRSATRCSSVRAPGSGRSDDAVSARTESASLSAVFAFHRVRRRKATAQKSSRPFLSSGESATFRRRCPPQRTRAPRMDMQVVRVDQRAVDVEQDG
jgi:hypothetical protein